MSRFQQVAPDARDAGLSAMTRIAIPPDLASTFAACEDAFEHAMREGYADNPAVVAALTDLNLRAANCNLMTAKGFVSVKSAEVHADRACRSTRKACIKLHAAIEQAAQERRLYNRCLTLLKRQVA